MCIWLFLFVYTLVDGSKKSKLSALLPLGGNDVVSYEECRDKGSDANNRSDSCRGNKRWNGKYDCFFSSKCITD